MLGVAVCLFLICLASFNVLHIHGSGGSSEHTPAAAHHCLLCLAAHLPLSIPAGPALPVLGLSRPAAPAPEICACYDSAKPFSLSIRPPPQA
jgi:hypothetical protein